jgi:hypothetical protein
LGEESDILNVKGGYKQYPPKLVPKRKLPFLHKCVPSKQADRVVHRYSCFGKCNCCSKDDIIERKDRLMVDFENKWYADAACQGKPKPRHSRDPPSVCFSEESDFGRDTRHGALCSRKGLRGGEGKATLVWKSSRQGTKEKPLTYHDYKCKEDCAREAAKLEKEDANGIDDMCCELKTTYSYKFISKSGQIWETDKPEKRERMGRIQTCSLWRGKNIFTHSPTPRRDVDVAETAFGKAINSGNDKSFIRELEYYGKAMTCRKGVVADISWMDEKRGKKW